MTTDQAARDIAASIFGERVSTCRRFPTGLTHWVYDVVLESGANVVVRLASPENRAHLAGGVFWHHRLAEIGVPVAAVLASDAEAKHPYMVLERLPGTDLGNVFDQLDPTQLETIARSVDHMQQQASTLPAADGFGYALNYRSRLHATWYDVLSASIDRSSRRIRAVGVVDESWVDRVSAELARAETRLADLRPTAFLHDATTKNVIVADGRVSGLVDVDHMAFGDPLWATALTRMSLLSADRPTTYADQLLPPHGDHEHFDLYTALFCLGFLAELGQRFNQDAAAPVEREHQRHLQTVLASLL